MTSHDATVTELTRAVADACASMQDDDRFSADATGELRRVVQATDPADVPEHPADVFGPWGGLPARARRALRAWIEEDVRRAMDRAVYGGPGAAAVRTVRSLDRFLVEVSGPGVLRQGAVTASGWLTGGRRSLGRRLDRRAALRRWDRSPRVGAPELLARMGRDSAWLLGDFARGVHVDPRARGFFHDRRRNVSWGYHLGLDLMVTDGGVVLIEANLEPGIMPPRFLGDVEYPLAAGLLDFVAERGFRRLVWLEAQRLPLVEHLWLDLVAEANARGVRLDVFEDPCMPRRRTLPPGVAEPNRWRPGLEVPNGTFVLRRNGYDVASDHLVTHKEACARALAAAFRARGEDRVRALELTRAPRGFRPARGPGLPNLVYKFPDGFAGQGVFFMRARDAGHAVAMARELDRRHGEPPGLFQPFTPSRTVDGCAYHVRADLLVSPHGPCVLARRRLVAGKRLRDDVEEGLFPERGVFASNVAGGGRLEPLPADEGRAVDAAALAVGEAFCAVLSDTFVVA